jgi:hypothetical protein
MTIGDRRRPLANRTLLVFAFGGKAISDWGRSSFLSIINRFGAWSAYNIQQFEATSQLGIVISPWIVAREAPEPVPKKEGDTDCSEAAASGFDAFLSAVEYR